MKENEWKERLNRKFPDEQDFTDICINKKELKDFISQEKERSRNEVLNQVKEVVKKLHLKGIDKDRDMHHCTEEEKEHYLLGIDDTCYEVSTLIDSLKIK